MTSICYAEPELIIALQNRVIFVNPDDLQIFKEVQLPSDLKALGLKEICCDTDEHKSDDDGSTREGKKRRKAATPIRQMQPIIQHVAIAPNKQLLAVTTVGQKALLLYQCRPEQATLLSFRPLARASSAMRFASDSRSLLVTDKTGDCYHYDCEQVEAPSKLLLGHLSIVYDVLWTTDMKYIITCDRDDKIRVTNYPKTYDIHTYCLGHKEFVSGMALLANDIIVSVSGDETLRLWNYMSGKELTRFELPAPGIRLAVRGDANEYRVAVLLHQPNESVGVYKIAPPPTTDEESDESWQINELELLSYPDLIVCNFCWLQERLYVVCSNSGQFCIKVAYYAKDVPLNWLSMVEEQFKDLTFNPPDVSAWFKKRYDNVTDYLERKKRRIEEKRKQKNENIQ